MEKIKINKKGQLKILESISVLLVFFFIVAMGISFYGKIQLQALDEAKEEFTQLDSTKISQKIIHLPELRCSLQNTDRGSCIDLYQARAWSAMLTDGECTLELGDDSFCVERTSHYFSQIGPGEIVLSRVYTATQSGSGQQDSINDIVLYNYTVGDGDVSDLDSMTTMIPVIIHDSVTQINDLGILRVKVYGYE